MASYQIKSGDTLSALAAKFGTTVQALAQANGISNPNLIKAGATLTIPSGASGTTSSSSTGSSLQSQLDAAKTAVQGLQTGLNSSTGQTYTPAQYTQAVTDKLGSNLPAGSSVADIENAFATGDWSGLTNSSGQPFSAADQAAAQAQATTDLAGGQQEAQAGDTASTANALAGDKLDYNKSLTDNAIQFQTDKTNQDQTAANQGVLFSGARAQKLSQLANSYQTNDAYNQAKYGQNIAGTADTYAQKYGTSAANNPTLSQYYQLGSQNYNPNVATGGVTTGGLSTIYNAGNYQGSQNALNQSQIQQRAAGFLANTANKLAGSPTTSLS
jgi:LysM repeat protein